MKNQYRLLKYIPLHKLRIDEFPEEFEEGDGLLGNRLLRRAARQTYKDRRWPDLFAYEKQECMDAMKKMIEDRFPKKIYSSIIEHDLYVELFPGLHDLCKIAGPQGEEVVFLVTEKLISQMLTSS